MMMKGAHTFTGGETEVKFWRKQLLVGCLRKYSDTEAYLLWMSLIRRSVCMMKLTPKSTCPMIPYSHRT